MTRNKYWLLHTLLFAGSISIAMATSNSEDSVCKGKPHTVHTVSVNANATCVLSKLYEPLDFCLADGGGHEIDGIPFSVSPGTPAGFGMIFDDKADFNMEYSLTCVKADGTDVKSPKVIFAIGADGPADPSITVVNLYGALGTWVSTGDGENYSIQF
jgi:hypothetical protein